MALLPDLFASLLMTYITLKLDCAVDVKIAKFFQLSGCYLNISYVQDILEEKINMSVSDCAFNCLRLPECKSFDFCDLEHFKGLCRQRGKIVSEENCHLKTSSSCRHMIKMNISFSTTSPTSTLVSTSQSLQTPTLALTPLPSSTLALRPLPTATLALTQLSSSTLASTTLTTSTTASTTLTTSTLVTTSLSTSTMATTLMLTTTIETTTSNFPTQEVLYEEPVQIMMYKK